MQLNASFSRLTQLPRRLATDRAGLAMIEFAFAAPLLLTIGLIGTETANLVITVLRVNQMAMMAADNAARVRASIDEGDINEVMIGMRFAGEEIKFGERGRVIISDLETNGQPDGNTGYKIGWQRCFGAKNVASIYGPEDTGKLNAAIRYGVTPTGLAVSQAGAMAPLPTSALMLAEVRYTYQPRIASMFIGNMELSAVQAFPVRERAQQALTNRNNLSATAKRLCDDAHLSAT